MLKIRTVILAAGMSTRLLPYTETLPKPMLPIKGKPILEYVISNLSIQGYKDIIITVHYKNEKIIDYFKDGHDFGVKIKYSYEEELLDTAGSLRKLSDELTSDFLVCGGSFLLKGVPLKSFEEFHKQYNGIGSIIFSTLKNNNFLQYYGQAIINEDHRIIKFQEKPVDPISNLIHTTYQIYNPRIFQFYEKDRKYSIPDDLLPVLMKRNERLYGYITKEQVFNISNIELYKNTVENWRM